MSGRQGMRGKGKRREGLIPIDLAVEGCGSHAKRMLTARRGGAGRDGQGSMQQERLAGRPSASWLGRWVSCRPEVRLGVESLAAVPGRC